MALTRINNQALPTLDSDKLPSGTVLQVKQGETSTEVLHTTSWADTGLSVSITPTSTSSKILVMVNQHCYKNGTSGGALRIMRGSTVIHSDSAIYQSYGDEAANRHFHNMQYLDSPSSTSALTYKTQAQEHSGDFRTQQASLFESRIIVMEIAG